MRSAPRLVPQANDAHSLERGHAFRVRDCARVVCPGPSATGRLRLRLRASLFRHPLGYIGTPHALTRWRRAAVEDVRHFAGYPVGGHLKRLVDMDVALRDASGGMPKNAAIVSSEKPRSPARLAKVCRKRVGGDVGQPGAFSRPDPARAPRR